jgi:selenocysteine-specific elongation factor
VLDVAPPRSFTKGEHLEFLERRRHAARAALPGLHAEEHGAARAADVRTSTGAEPPPELLVGSWCVTERVRDAVATGLQELLQAFHDEHPLEEGASLGDVRAAVAKLLREAGAPTEASLIDALVDATPGVVRTASQVRLETHAVSLEGRTDDTDKLLEAIGGEAEATPPSVTDLVAAGTPRDVIDAAARQGLIVRLSPEIVVTRHFTDRAIELIRSRAAQGTSVSQLREHLGTSRKYAVPLVEWLDREGLTRRQGDLRYPR